MIIHHAAARIRRVIGLTRGSNAQAGQAAAKLPDFVGGHDFGGDRCVWAHIGAASHDGAMVSNSLFVRHRYSAQANAP